MFLKTFVFSIALLAVGRAHAGCSGYAKRTGLFEVSDVRPALIYCTNKELKGTAVETMWSRVKLKRGDEITEAIIETKSLFNHQTGKLQVVEACCDSRVPVECDSAKKPIRHQLLSDPSLIACSNDKSWIVLSEAKPLKQ